MFMVYLQEYLGMVQCLCLHPPSDIYPSQSCPSGLHRFRDMTIINLNMEAFQT